MNDLEIGMATGIIIISILLNIIQHYHMDKLLDSHIVTEGVKTEDLLIGDKNAVMVAARILAYGGDYTVEVTNPNTGETQQQTFDLTSLSDLTLTPTK